MSYIFMFCLSLLYSIRAFSPISTSSCSNAMYFLSKSMKNNNIITVETLLKATSVDVEDDEETEYVNRIKSNYLVSKFKNCRQDGGKEICRTLCTISEIETLLRTILPPVSVNELKKEITSILSEISSESVKSNNIDVDEFLNAAIQNTYWKKAGDLVVKELIFLDCLHSYYYDKQALLQDGDYEELKEDLTWEGSVAVTLSGQEAHFIKAVSAHASGQNEILTNTEYDELKKDLLKKKSWVVNRQLDPLEKMGMSTFMSYLHRAL